MAVKYIPYTREECTGEATLSCFNRLHKIKYQNINERNIKIDRGMPLYEMKHITGNENADNLVIRGECISACAYLKEKGIKVDLVYIDPPFASGADYSKKVVLRPTNDENAEDVTEKNRN